LDADPAKSLAELARLWDRGSLLLWALAIGTFVGFVVLAAVALTGSPTFVQANDTASPWLLLASIIFAAFAGLKQYQERTIQTVRLVPNEMQSYYHRAIQADGSVNTQITIYLEVFNIGEKSIWLPDLKLLRPRSHAPVLIKAVSLKDQSGVYYGSRYELPPGAKTPGSVLLMIQGDLMDQIAQQGVKLCIGDQFGHRHILKLASIRRS
jgi:hypothetical protein